MHQNTHMTSLLIYGILCFAVYLFKFGQPRSTAVGLVNRAAAFPALPLQPVRRWRGNPVDKALLFHDGEFPL